MDKRREWTLDMLQLWTVHVSLTREVVLADSLKTANLTSSLNALLYNQINLGQNLARVYGEQAGSIYAKLLTQHINIAVDIVNAAIAGTSITILKQQWYNNANDIALFLSRVSKHITYSVIKTLL